MKSVVLGVPENLPQAPVRETYAKICEAFLAEEVAKKFLEVMPNRSMPVRRDELRHYIRALHPFAQRSMVNVLSEKGMFSTNEIIDPVAWESVRAGMTNSLMMQLDLEPSKLEMLEDLFSSSDLIVEQMKLIQDFNRPPSLGNQNAELLNRDFPDSYVAALDELLHTPWYAACFVANPANASMWATYGDSHKGACLKFKVSEDGAGRPSLHLNQMNGFHSTSKGEFEATYGFVPHAFYKVTYTEAYPAIDFFNSIGRLPMPALNGFWFKSQDGEISEKRIRSIDTDAWRKKYWDEFHAGTICKTSEWAHEEEYRLTLTASMLDFAEPSTRKLTYKFSDLAGIVFGAKMPDEDKLKIMTIVSDKCKQEKRDDFEFYQSVYSRKHGGFKIVPLRLIKPKIG